MQLKKTNDYEIFKFRSDNRESINLTHVKRLVESIKSKDLLEFRPIAVNKDMEIIDGQHRFLAAKELGKPIYYQVKADLVPEDIILMNIAKAWRAADYLNYYVKNGYPEYIKLKKFLDENNVSLRVAMGLTVGSRRDDGAEFRNGEFKFTAESANEEIELCWQTINYIKKMNGYSAYTSSGRFWKALTKLVKHNLFDPVRWKGNLERMIEKVGPRAREDDYLKLFTEIHNWRNAIKIDLLEEV